MIVKKVEDLLVYQRAMQLWEAVNALLDRPAFAGNRDLRDQVRDAIDSVVANIAEGFQQPTDKSFARYLYTANGSTAETRARLNLSFRRGYISSAELGACEQTAAELARMTTGLIKYLRRSDRRNRGVNARDDGADD